MPIIYHNRSSSNSSDSMSSSASSADLTSPTVTDADDSIVLSDLVRTGEASRLRRRGAMRLEHGLGHHGFVMGANATANNPFMIRDWNYFGENGPQSPRMPDSEGFLGNLRF